MRMLVVEDDPISSRLMKSVLESRGHAVTCAGDAEAALAMHIEQPFELLLLDLNLPGMDGLELCRRVRLQPGSERIMILVVTVRDGAGDLKDVLDAGADDYICKPFNVASLNVRMSVAERQAHLLNERFATHEKLNDSYRFLRSTLNALTAQVAILSPTGMILEINRAWREFAESNTLAWNDYGLGANYIKICDHSTGPCSEEAIAVARGIREVIAGVRDNFALEYPCHSPDAQRWFVVRVAPFMNERPARVVISHENITERKLVEEKLREEAIRDSVTALYNRRHFVERLRELIGAAGRYDSPLSLCICDLDKFKLVNDTYGHLKGDEVLFRFGRLIKAGIRNSDVACRYGGDEFCIAFPQTSASEASMTLERIRVSVLETQFEMPQGGHFSVSATFGVSQFVPGQMKYKNLLRAADLALYNAKEQGRNCVVVNTETTG